VSNNDALASPTCVCVIYLKFSGTLSQSRKKMARNEEQAFAVLPEQK